MLDATKLDDNGVISFVDELDIPITFDKLASGQPDGGMDQPYLQMSSAHNGLWEDTASGTQNVVCVTVHNGVPEPSSNMEWYDTSFGTIIIRKKASYMPEDQETQCQYHGSFLRPFVPRSAIENEWYLAYYAKVKNF